MKLEAESSSEEYDEEENEGTEIQEEESQDQQARLSNNFENLKTQIESNMKKNRQVFDVKRMVNPYLVKLKKPNGKMILIFKSQRHLQRTLIKRLRKLLQCS